MEVLITYIQPFFGWLLQTTLIASVVICLILLIQKMLGGKLGPRWCHALWLVLLIRMVLPWSPSSRLSLSNLVPSLDRQIQRRQLLEAAKQHKVSAHKQTAGTPEAIPGREPESEVAIQTSVTPKPPAITNVKVESKPRLASFRRVLPILWLAGAVVIGAYLLMSDFALWRIIKREGLLLNQKTLELFEQCKSRMNVQMLVAIVPSDRIKSPALFGFIRPRLLLPSDMLEKASEEEMRYVFLHELAHLKRCDIYVGWLTSLLQVLHWFNPLVWFAFYRMRSDREFACDALVLTKMGQEKSQEYGGAIVGLLRRFSRSRPLPAMAGILENRSQLKRRMTMIAQFKKNSYQWSPLAVILIIIIGFISLPNAISTKASGISTAQPATHITLRRVWSGPETDAFGTPSPDGRYLSHVDWDTGDLAIRELATGKTRHLTNKKAWQQPDAMALYSIISPDGRLVVYSWLNKLGTYDLCVTGIDATGNRTLYSYKEHDIFPSSWSSDGKRILARKYGEKSEIISISVEDGSVEALKAFENSPWGDRLCYSPNNQFIAYHFPVTADSGNYDISMLDIETNDVIVLTEHPANDRLLVWIPNSDEILFTSDRAGTHDVWAIKVIDGKVQGSPSPIMRDVGQISPQGITQDGSLFFNRYTRKFTIEVMPFEAKTGNIQIASKKPLLGSNSSPEWSPDGKSLAYVTEKEDKRRLHIQNLETGEERELANDIHVRAPRWSPDGRLILVPGFDHNRINQRDYRGGIYMIDVQTGQVTQLIQFPPDRAVGWARSTAEWSLEAKAIFYLAPRGIVRCELESGREEQLYLNNKLDRALELSPDGRTLVFCTDEDETPEGKVSILTLPVLGGEPKELCNFEEYMGGIQVPRDVKWTYDVNHVLFATSDKMGSTVWRVSSQGGDPEVILKSKDRVHSLSVHPKGKEIAVCTYLQESAIWAMENFLPTAPVVKPEPATTVRRIGSDWGTFASLSPDGKYMCDVDWNTETLAVLELATGKVRHLTSRSSDGAYPLDSAISPESKEVAYLWWNPKTKASRLHIVGLDGSNPRTLRKGGYPIPRDWSTDGKKILAVVSENDVQQMVWVSTSDGSLQRIASFNGESLGYPGKFDISPDGRFIAYDRPQDKDTSKRDIFAFDFSENREVSFIKHPANDKLLGWTPDGKHVLFASNRTGSWDAWLLQIADGRPQGFPELAKHGIGDVRPIGFTPQGSYYYGHEQILTDVFVARLDLGTGEVLSEPVPVRQTGATACHDWSPDGRYLAYCERRSDESQAIHIRTLATGRERTLANNLPYIRWLRWSPDMRSFLIDGYKRGDSQGVIFKIDAQTGELSDIVRSTTEVLIRPEMSPDGKKLFYGCGDPDSKTGRLIARDVESGREKELFRIVPPVRLTGSALSPDGQWFVLSIISSATRPAVPLLKILSTAGEELRDLIQFDKSEKLRAVGVTWMPDSKNVLFWKWFQGDKELELWRISAEGGEPRKLCSRKAFGHMRVHPDGQRVAFYDRSTTRGVWVMENFLPATVASAGK